MTHASQHTKVPWAAGPVFQKEGKAIFVTDASKPGKWQKRLDDKTGVFSERDATLISAAPELLEALEYAYKVLGEAYDGSISATDIGSALQPCAEAIAKAKGGAA